MRKESKQAIEAAEDILLKKIASIGFEPFDDIKPVDNFDQIRTAYNFALGEFAQQYRKLRHSKKIAFRSEEDGLELLSNLQVLRNVMSNNYFSLTAKEEEEYKIPINNVAYTTYSKDSNVWSMLKPEFMSLYQNMFENFCHKMNMDLESLKDHALSVYSGRLDEKIYAADRESNNKQWQQFVDTSAAYKNAMCAFRDEVNRIRLSSDPDYAKAIMDSHPAYGEAFRKYKNKAKLSTINGSSHEIHQFENSRGFIDNTIYKHSISKNEPAFKEAIFRYFSEEHEQEMLRHYGVFLTPLRHALMVYCSLSGMDVDSIVKEERAAYVPPTFIEKIQKITKIPQDEIAVVIKEKSKQTRI